MARNSAAPVRQPYERTLKILRIWHRRTREGFLTVLLAIQIFTLFLIPAARAAGLPVPRAAVITLLLVFVTLAIVLSRSRGAIVTMVISVALTIVGAVWHQEQPDLATDSFSAAGQILTQFSLLWVVATAVFGGGPTTHHRILGAVVMYLSIGMIFTSIDILLAQTIPGAFLHVPRDSADLRESLTYFSFSTLTTSSFGDILPVHPIARNFANLEAICGQLFPATLLARIVSLHNAKERLTQNPHP